MISYKLQFNKEFDLRANESVDIFRSAFFKILEVYKPVYEAFYFEKKGFPDVIFQKPFKDSVTLHIKKSSEAFKNMQILLSILKTIPLNIKGIEFKLKRYTQLQSNIVVPIASNKMHYYKTITPILLFTGNHFKMYYSILEKYKNNSIELEKELKRVASELIKSNLKFQAQNLIKYKKYEQFEDINIEWIDFTIRFISFHKNEKKSPAIFGSFKTSYELPRFIGHKIGKGFGQINKFDKLLKGDCYVR